VSVWGGLNPALTAWREGINMRFPRRGRASDGGYADKLHGSTSEHQPDADGTVDAFDMDVNLLGSNEPTGTREEQALLTALKLDFEQDTHNRSLLWISNKIIANREIRDWARRKYGGKSPHTEHAHWQSRQSKERDGRPWQFVHTDALLARMEEEEEDDMSPADIKLAAKENAAAIMASPVRVGTDTWRFDTAVGYIARKLYEIDKSVDDERAEQDTPPAPPPAPPPAQ